TTYIATLNYDDMEYQQLPSGDHREHLLVRAVQARKEGHVSLPRKVQCWVGVDAPILPVTGCTASPEAVPSVGWVQNRGCVACRERSAWSEGGMRARHQGSSVGIL